MLFSRLYDERHPHTPNRGLKLGQIEHSDPPGATLTQLISATKLSSTNAHRKNSIPMRRAAHLALMPAPTPSITPRLTKI